MTAVTDTEIESIATTAPPAKDRRGIRGWLPTIAMVGLAALLTVGIFIVDQRELVAGLAVLLMLVLMFMKLPVALALAIPGLLGLYALNGVRALANVMSSTPYHAVAQWSLTVLPMFILMGLLLWSSGLTERIYIAARHWLGWLPGGLGVGTNTAGAGLAAVSGSTIGVTYALARVGIPEMLRAGYDKRLALSSVIVAGLPGQLIPPSTFLVIVAGLMEVPVGPQLIAGIGPGLLVAFLFSLTIVAYAIIFPTWGGRGNKSVIEKVSLAERVRSLNVVWPVLILIVAILGGMFSGILTATEAGAVGAFGAAVICLVMQRRNRPWKLIFKGAVASVASVGAIFLLLIGAQILAQLLAVSGLGRLLAAGIADLGLDRVQFLLLMMVIYLILGMFMDPLSMLLITIPVVLPILNSLEVNLLWYGVFAVFMSELAVLTPPVGILSYILHGIVQDKEVSLGHKISLRDVFAAVGLMLPMAIVVCIILILLPDIATWLPSVMAP